MHCDGQLSMVSAAHTHTLHHRCTWIGVANTLSTDATYLEAIFMALTVFQFPEPRSSVGCGELSLIFFPFLILIFIFLRIRWTWGCTHYQISPDNGCKYSIWHFSTRPVLCSWSLQMFSLNHSTLQKYMAPQLGVAPSQFSSISVPVITLVANHLTTFSVATITSRGAFSIIIQLFPIAIIQSFAQKQTYPTIPQRKSICLTTLN